MGRIIVDGERCKGCGLCLSFCPKKLLVFGAELNTQGFPPVKPPSEQECTGCAVCAEMCPDVAISEVWR